MSRPKGSKNKKVAIDTVRNQIQKINARIRAIKKEFGSDVADYYRDKMSLPSTDFINKKGELLSNQWFDRVGDFEEGVIRVLVKGKGVNFINQKCELISEQWFDGIVEFNEGVATVKLDSKYNFINKNGKILSKQWFDDGFYWKDGIARVQLNNKFYDLNLNNNSITELE